MTDTKPSPVQRRLTLVADASTQEPTDPGYLHAVLCQLGLPRRGTDATKVERASGNASLQIVAGDLWDGHKWQPQPLPHGTRARLALIHIATRAVQTRSPVVDVGRSTREFLLRLGMHINGREHATLQQQMRSLAACQMRIGIGTETIMDAQPIRRFKAWHGPAEHDEHDAPEQGTLWAGSVTLTAEFYDSLTEFAVPLDLRAVAALHHSALALDAYAWLAHRLWRVRSPVGDRVSWEALRQQFGADRETKPFKQEMKVALTAVVSAYPDARIEQVRGGLRLLPSKPPVPRLIVGGATVDKPASG
jgi:replication initiator protein